MLYQDRRALRCVRSGIMWVATLTLAMPIATAIPRALFAVAALSATVAMLGTYFVLLHAIINR